MLSKYNPYLLFICCTTILINTSFATSNSLETTIRTLGITKESGIYSWNAIIDNQGKLWTGIYTNRQRLIIKTPIDTEIPLIANRNLNPSGLAFTSANNGNVWIAYRNKAPERGIFLINSNSPLTPYKVSGDSLPLARIALESDQQGGAYALWYGEPAEPTAPSINNYWLWFNHLYHDGKISTPEKVIQGIYPLWIHHPDGKIAIFGWYHNDIHGYHIGMRLRDTAGKFSSEVMVAKIDYLSFPVGTFTAGNRWFIYWVAQYGKLKDEFLIEGAYSDNQGQTWTTFNLESLKKLDIRNIAAAADANGHIALAITGRYRNPQPGQTNKFNSYLITSNDNGTNWNKPLNLNPEYANYQSPNAKVAFIGETKQHLLLLVEDWRTIRSNIRYWMSQDNGITWQIQDRIFPLDNKYNYQLTYNDESIYNYKDQVNILVERLGDELGDRTILSITKNVQDLINTPEYISSKPNEERLKDRVNLYGKTLIDKNYQATYELFDPFYRARIDFIGHMKNQGRITYTKAEYANAQIQGNLATVQFHVIASVPPFKGTTGEIIQAPPRDMMITLRCLWIDNEWYMEYYSEARELRYTRY